MNDFSYVQRELPSLVTEQNFLLAKHTTIGLGGQAKLAVFPQSVDECVRLFSLLHSRKIPYYPLGVGANVLPPDGAFEGVVVNFCRMKGIFAERDRIFAQAGVTGGALTRFALSRQLGGAEWLSGIPTSLGGGIAMNAGVKEGHFSDIVDEVLAIERGRLKIFSKADCQFSTKSSVFLSGITVLGGIFKLKLCEREEIERRLCYFRKKRSHLPKGRSMGCVFVNPSETLSAGKLIERCGMKGVRIGGAVVSDKHANFILQEGGTSSDVSALIALVKKRVWEREGIILREEVRRMIPIT